MPEQILSWSDNDDGVPNGEPLRTAEWHIYTTQLSAEWEMVYISTWQPPFLCIG